MQTVLKTVEISQVRFLGEVVVSVVVQRGVETVQKTVEVPQLLIDKG